MITPPHNFTSRDFRHQTFSSNKSYPPTANFSRKSLFLNFLQVYFLNFEINDDKTSFLGWHLQEIAEYFGWRFLKSGSRIKPWRLDVHPLGKEKESNIYGEVHAKEASDFILHSLCRQTSALDVRQCQLPGSMGVKWQHTQAMVMHSWMAVHTRNRALTMES